MEQQEEEKKSARDPLKKVEPVPCIRIGEHIDLCLARDQHTVDRVIGKRQENAENLDKQEKRDVVNVLYVIIKDLRAVHRRYVRIDVYEVEHAKRHDSRNLMEFTEKECR